MYVHVDERMRIDAYNGTENLSGNDGWVHVNQTIADPITEEHGVPIYKVQNGRIVSRTQAEIEEDIPEPVPPEIPEIEQLRLQVQEQQTQLNEQADALIELAELIGG